MSNSLNRVTLMGNLGANPELQFASSENPCLKLSLATTDVWKDRNQVEQKHTEWHRIELWGPRARALSSILTKGMRVFVDGSIRSRTVAGEGGNTRRFVDIRARDLILVEPRRARDGAQASPASSLDDVMSLAS
ncbi:MAG: single-stranded DNA-binding protein [Deltaproteobacteria bacterium]|nr:single-stranded DNA-binding protein [Deltaproteobacteria bacterium]